MNVVSHKNDLTIILEGCKKGISQCQRSLYDTFFSYTLKICLRYTQDRESALEIMNDGYLKIFNKIAGFVYHPDGDRLVSSFKAWIKKIMVRTAIDHYRKKENHFFYKEITEDMEYINIDATSSDNSGYTDLVKMIQQLPSSYKWVFNLYVIDGYSHKEIASMLHISESTSRSNLAKAKEHLRKLLKKRYEEVLAKYN